MGNDESSTPGGSPAWTSHLTASVPRLSPAAEVSRPMLRMIFHGTIAATPPNPSRSFAIGYILRHLGQRPNGNSNANYPPSRD